MNMFVKKCILCSMQISCIPQFMFSLIILFWICYIEFVSFWGMVYVWKVGSLSGAVTIVSVISGPSIFCSVLWNFQALSWEQGADRPIKVTTLCKQICIKKKSICQVSIESLKEDLEQVLTSLNELNLKSTPFNWNYYWNKSKQFKNCFIYCPKIYS